MANIVMIKHKRNCKEGEDIPDAPSMQASGSDGTPESNDNSRVLSQKQPSTETVTAPPAAQLGQQ